MEGQQFSDLDHQLCLVLCQFTSSPVKAAQRPEHHLFASGTVAKMNSAFTNLSSFQKYVRFFESSEVPSLMILSAMEKQKRRFQKINSQEYMNSSGSQWPN